MIDNKIYCIGGQGFEEKVFNEFIQIDITTKKACQFEIKGTIPHIMQSSLAPVFYQSKVGKNGQLSHKTLAGEIEWGEALDLIKIEGFYMFGGKNQYGEAMNNLYVIQLKEDKFGAFHFTIK